MKYLKVFGFFVFALAIVFGAFLYSKYSSFKYSESEKDFVYLANILYDKTKDIQGGQEKLIVMTDWLHTNVKHISPYPPGFNGKGVVNVIKGGVGNCGYQSCNISVFADLLGYPNHRIYHFQKQRGSMHDHAFAEISVDGKWKVYDPDLIMYQKDKSNNVLSMATMKSYPQLVDNKTFKDIITQKDEKVFVVAKSWQPTPKAFGKDGYKQFVKAGGEEGFKRKLVWDKYGSKLISRSILIAALLSLLFMFFTKQKKSKIKS